MTDDCGLGTVLVVFNVVLGCEVLEYQPMYIAKAITAKQLITMRPV